MLKRCFSLLLALFLCGSLCVSAGPLMTASASSLDDYFGEGWEDGLDDALDQVTGAGSDGTGAGDQSEDILYLDPMSDAGLNPNSALMMTPSLLATGDPYVTASVSGLSFSGIAHRDSGFRFFLSSLNTYIYFPYLSDMSSTSPLYIVVVYQPGLSYLQIYYSSVPMYFSLLSTTSGDYFRLYSSDNSVKIKSLYYSFSQRVFTVQDSSSGFAFPVNKNYEFFTNYSPTISSDASSYYPVSNSISSVSASTSSTGVYSSSEFVQEYSSLDNFCLLERQIGFNGWGTLRFQYSISNAYMDFVLPASYFGVDSSTVDNSLVFSGPLLVRSLFEVYDPVSYRHYVSDLNFSALSFLVDGTAVGYVPMDSYIPFSRSSSFTSFDSTFNSYPYAQCGLDSVAIPISSTTETIGFRFYYSGSYSGSPSVQYSTDVRARYFDFQASAYIDSMPSFSLATLSGNGEVLDGIDELKGEVLELQTSVNQVQNSVNQVQNELSGVNDSVQALPDQIGDKVTGIFVPDISDAETDRSKWENLLASKLGFVYQGYELVDMTVESLRDSADGEAYAFTFPGVSVPIQNVSYEIIKEQEVSLDNKLMSVLRPFLGTILCIVSTLAVFNLMVSFVESFISGDNIADWLRTLKNMSNQRDL